jgi:hypothetical protein
MFIFEITVVLYFIKILSGSRNFYRLPMTSLTSTNVFTISCLSIGPPPPRPGKFSSTALVQSFGLAKSLLHYLSTIRTIRRLFADYSYYSSTICGLFVLFVDYLRTIRRLFVDYSRTIGRLFADYSYYSSTIRGLFVLFVHYSYYSSTIRTIRFTILVLSIAAPIVIQKQFTRS